MNMPNAIPNRPITVRVMAERAAALTRNIPAMPIKNAGANRYMVSIGLKLECPDSLLQQ